MPNRRASDPLVTLPLRVPASLRARLESFAAEHGGTLSDALRAHLTLDGIEPIGAPRPRRRPAPKLRAAGATDPVLLRQLAAIGSNLNQLARAANAGTLGGRRFDVIEVLSTLHSIQAQVGAITVGKHAPEPGDAH